MSVRATLALLEERTAPPARSIRSYRVDRATRINAITPTTDLPGMRLALALADLALDCEEHAILRRARVTRAAILRG
jgi:hypothetical protein